ncbi:MAG: sigma-54-dependent Fis family transcriptional regulator [Deltaproteobacteria bacterium]|nr:sigma-54-dependent Fis family transcriptional regulator [Deltaproteobacteria bacterium]
MNVLIIDDNETLRELLARELSHLGHDVVLAPDAARGLAGVAEVEPDVVLLDLMLPDRPGIDVLRQLRAERPAIEIVVLTAHGTVDTAISAMKLGAFDYLQKPCHLQELDLTIQRAYERRRLSEENARLKGGLVPRASGAAFAGEGPAFDELVRLIEKVAASDSTVLIRGETGTGKDLVGRLLHRRSQRGDQPFVVVDCASLQENLLQSELFGYEKGAFTGADRHKYGLFDAADGGTIFLDEIGDVSPVVQAGLLRVLETSAFRRLGGTREVTVNVRLLAATNCDLEDMVGAGRFRQDLYYRLNTIHIKLPPLRDRHDEIPLLVGHFLARHNARRGTPVTVSPGAIELLKAYGWPGNIRELKNVIERACVLVDGHVIRVEDLPPGITCCQTGAGSPDQDGPLPLAALEARHISQVLKDAGGRRAQAAKLLGISERNLYRKIKEYEIDKAGK